MPTKGIWTCTACGQVYKSNPEGVCRNFWCAAPGRPLESVFAVGNYEGALRKAIVAYKYRWDLRWARPFGGLLSGFLARHATWFEEYEVMCPVPQFAGPGARRPWQHVGLVCAEASRLSGGAWPAESLVDKVVETGVMSTKSHTARRELAGKSLTRAFRVVDRAGVQGSRILLVDDVCASGYTLLTVARVLKRAGAEDVTAVVLARARWRPERP